GTVRAREIQAGRGEQPFPTLTTGEQAFLESAGQRTAARRRGGVGDGRGSEIEKERNDAIFEWQRARSAIERDTNQQILDETQQAGAQRTRTIADYEQNIAEMAQDFGLRRQRAEEDHARAL